MKSVFDIIGPVMIGPSSSHTAGAARLGRLARKILGEEVRQVQVKFHGSFAQTYRGHGTDRAIVAGLLDMAADDERLPEALELAKTAQIEIEFLKCDLGDVHPNTVCLEMTGRSGRRAEVTGSSLGGGSIIVNRINGYQVELTGEYFTLITIHQDKPGIVALITHILAQAGVNVAFMRVSRSERGAQALLILEADEPIAESVYEVVSNLPRIELAMLVPPL
ncbi:MAG: L-serine ammonia-lyase, iron-sulfur-dependent subunit beta [Sporomusaceae bacterium]|nr:L-serine ammonia-lyase, iron-sulfur-dependent subunit beta [Sporomusaceae bacterium]